MISHGIETVCPIGWSKGHVIMKFVATVIPLMELDIGEIYNSMIWEVILIGDSTTLLDYRHQFIGGLHAVDSRSRTKLLSVSLLFI